MQHIKIASADILGGLRKAGFESLVNSVLLAEESQKKIEAALSKDRTLTEHSASIKAGEYAQKLYARLVKQFDVECNPLKEKISKLDSKVEPFRKIRGTTDMLILGQYLPIMTTKTEVLRIAAIDQDGARAALLSPVIKYKINLSAAAQGAINVFLDKHVLGKEYPALQEAQADLNSINRAGDHLVYDLGKYHDELVKMKENIIDPQLLEVS